ncbi:family 16 glycosylhydrolase [Flavobacterium sp.]|uniref:family 16 glycosylhydrolase n=1 Tax=Flavobacterium sp. TaxID=239 RepID=UPI003F698CF9
MIKKIKTILMYFLFTNICLAQIDVVYNDLVWSDEFNDNGAVNSTNWFHQTQIPAGGSWFNGEVQHYTNELTNSFVSNGNLNIVAKKEPYTSQGITKQYTSARLNSKFSFKYGRVDIRAKAPNGQGTWPALWLLGKNINEDGGFFDAAFGTTNWPACGEIDIMEHGIFPNQPLNYVGSAIHTTSSSGNTVNKGGIQASDIQNNYHVYSMNWSPNQITFLLDGVIYYTYNPSVKNAATWPFDAEQYLLLNVAMGGFAGTIPSNFTETSMVIDYVRVYQNTVVDTEAPTSFTANLGTISGSSVELLLNGNDNSGTVSYNITYNGTTINTFSPSGVQKSIVIPNLVPNTTYTFTVTATDATGNAAVNNPIVLNATTTAVLGCNGTDSIAQQGAFSIGYSYDFETIGNSVKITFELLDTDKVGVVGILWQQSPFTETTMTNVSGNIFTSTVTNLTAGQTISYAVKFAYAGGLSVTKYFNYVVGNDCSLGVNQFSNLDDVTYLNPVSDYLYFNTNQKINKIEIYNLSGSSILNLSSETNVFDLRKLLSGIYLVNIYSENEQKLIKIIKN